MGFFNNLTYDLTGPFRSKISEGEFRRIIYEATDLIVPPSQIAIPTLDRYKPISEWDWSEEADRLVTAKGMEVFEAYNTHKARVFSSWSALKQVQPRRKYRRLHIHAAYSLNAYMRTLNSHALNWHPFAKSDRKDAQIWDSIMYEVSTELVGLMEDLQFEIPDGLHSLSFSPPLHDLIDIP